MKTNELLEKKIGFYAGAKTAAEVANADFVFYTADFTSVKKAADLSDEEKRNIVAISGGLPKDIPWMKRVDKKAFALVPDYGKIVKPYLDTVKVGGNEEQARVEYIKAFGARLKDKSPLDLIQNGQILCCFDAAWKFCHRHLVTAWAERWGRENGVKIICAGEYFQQGVVGGYIDKRQTKLNFEPEEVTGTVKEEIEMENTNIIAQESDTVVVSAQTDTAIVAANEVNKIEDKKEETIKMTNEMNNIENKAAEVRTAIEAANQAELVKIEATKKYVTLRDAARAAMTVKKVATVKKQIANQVVIIKKTEFTIVELNGKIAAAVEAGKATKSLENRLVKAQERIAKAQNKIAELQEKLTVLTETPVVVPEVKVEVPATAQEVAPVTEESDIVLFDHVNDINVVINMIADKAAALAGEIEGVEESHVALQAQFVACNAEIVQAENNIVLFETVHDITTAALTALKKAEAAHLDEELKEIEQERLEAGDVIEKDEVDKNVDELDSIADSDGEDGEIVAVGGTKVVKANLLNRKPVVAPILTNRTVVGTVVEPQVEDSNKQAEEPKPEATEEKASAEAPKAPVKAQPTHVNPFAKKTAEPVPAPETEEEPEEVEFIPLPDRKPEFEGFNPPKVVSPIGEYRDILNEGLYEQVVKADISKKNPSCTDLEDIMAACGY